MPITFDFKKFSNQNFENLLNKDFNNLKDNLFIRSNNNTLILENIDQLPLNYQKKFLFFLENNSFFNEAKIKLNQKLITITEKNLDDEVNKGNFTKRLLDRISIDKIICPSLKTRREDIMPIVNYYLNYYNKIYACGLDNYKLTSMESLGKNIKSDEFNKLYLKFFLEELKKI